MSKTTAIVSSGLTSSSISPPTYTLAVVSINPLSGKSSLCKRLIDSNIDNYRISLSKHQSHSNAHWLYWGSVRHRRSDEKREALFHLIEHSTIAIDDNEHYDNYIKRITTLTLRSEDKFSKTSDYPQLKTFPKDKLSIDAFLCIHDLSSSKQISDLLFLLHSLFKTRRPVILITTKNDLIENQTQLAIQFEHSIRRSTSSDSQLLLNIPIIHTSAHEHINIHGVLKLALYVCDEPKKPLQSKALPLSYDDACKNEQSLKRMSRERLINERLIPIVELLLSDQKSKLSRNWDYVRLQKQKHRCYSPTEIPSSSWSDVNRDASNLVIPADLLETSKARLCFELSVVFRAFKSIFSGWSRSIRTFV